MNWASVVFPLWLFSPRVLLVLFFLAAGALMVAFNYSYSDGNRAGYIQKFSIWDDAVAQQLSQVMGKRVVLHYKEFRYLPTTCFGDTPYFVDRVELQE